jgi:hypothetical protein
MLEESQKVGVATITFDGRRITIVIDAGRRITRGGVSIGTAEVYLLNIAKGWDSAGVSHNISEQNVVNAILSASHNPGKECTIG